MHVYLIFRYIILDIKFIKAGIPRAGIPGIIAGINNYWRSKL